jgi:predicted amidophosphoribosyltransferase
MLLLKENRFVREETAAALVARRLRERAEPLTSEFLGENTALVPIPRSGLLRRGALWPALEIAQSLHREGFGSRVIACLSRRVALAKAATSNPEGRPKARAHLESLEVEEPLSLPTKVTLIDDVVTRGAQLFGAAWKIWSVRPNIEVRAFAVIRTISDANEFTTLAAPCTGRIEWREEECRRRP